MILDAFWGEKLFQRLQRGKKLPHPFQPPIQFGF
jgi:hypothetical protein